MLTNKEKGYFAENKVSDYLISKGFNVLERNFRTRYGEIDIVASISAEIHFIEVKCLSPKWEISEISKKIDFAKQRRIKHTSSAYLAHKTDIKYDIISFDVAVVYKNLIHLYIGAF